MPQFGDRYISVFHANPDQITATDIGKEVARCEGQGEEYELYSLDEEGKAEYGQMIYFPASGRAGIAWGADATWTDCTCAEDAIERVCITGDVIN